MKGVIFNLEDVGMKIRRKKVKIIVISIVTVIAANYFLYLYNFVITNYQRELPILMVCGKEGSYGLNCIGLGYSISCSDYDSHKGAQMPFGGLVIVKVFGKEVFESFG